MMNNNIIFDELIMLEIEHINKGLRSANIKIGKYYMENAINSFTKNELKYIYGNNIPDNPEELKYFIIEIFKGIEEKFKKIVLNEVVIPILNRTYNYELEKDIKETFREYLL